jgi:hypothetical protein
VEGRGPVAKTCCGKAVTGPEPEHDCHRTRSTYVRQRCTSQSRQELDAGKPHVQFCEGGATQAAPLLDHARFGSTYIATLTKRRGCSLPDLQGRLWQKCPLAYAYGLDRRHNGATTESHEPTKYVSYSCIARSKGTFGVPLADCKL